MKTKWVAPVVKMAIAIGLLAWVASNLTWRDEARSKTDPDTTRRGTITADTESKGSGRPWEVDPVRFTFDEEPGATLPGASALPDGAFELAQGEWSVKPGFPTLLRHLHMGPYLAAVGLFFLALCFSIVRWHWLLRAVGVPMSFWQCFRLTFVGQFFNLVVPGLTGGDLVKAFFVARVAERKTVAVVTIFVDRILGMLAIALVAAFAVLFVWSSQTQLALAVIGFALAMVAGILVFFSATMRRLFRIEALFEKLPGGNLLRTIDEAVLLYRHHLGTVGWAMALSFLNHAVATLGMFFLAQALVSTAEAPALLELYVIYPIAGIVSALPIAPAGLGIGESAYGYLFREFGRSYAVGIACSLIYRMTFMIFSLCGGLFLLFDRERVSTREMERALEGPTPS